MSVDCESVVSTLATLDLSEYWQMGAASITQTEASFLSRLLSMTSDSDSIAAAVSGRRDALGESPGRSARPLVEIASSPTGEVAGVHLVVATERTVVARVRDDSGIWDVTYGPASGGWSCSCQEAGNRCAHVLAVAQVTQQSTVVAS